VEEVPVVAARRENHGWDIVPNRALRWGVGTSCWRVGSAHGDLPNQEHDLVLPLSCVRAELDGRVLRPVGGRRDDVNGGGFAMDAQVALHGAGVGLMIAEVAA